MKVCPNCGTQLTSETKFCVKCGTDVTNVEVKDQEQGATKENILEQEQPEKQASSDDNNQQFQQQAPQQSQASAQPSSFSVGARSYWQWLVNSWKAPFKVQDVNKYFGLGTLIGENVIFVLSVYIIVRGFIRKASDAANSFVEAFGGESSTASYMNLSPAFFIKMLIFLLLASFLLAGAAYLIKRTFYESKEDFLTFLNRVANYTNLNVIFNVVIFLFAFLSTSIAGVSLIFIIISLIMSMWSLGLYTSVLATNLPVKHDRIYGVFLLTIVNAIIIAVIMYLGGGALFSEISSMFEDIF
ncbi:zinc ribbon domain-containing protein [Ligilactobacillus pobuzihii]|uniref:zinc ribbon domain-containing protein n=1 Tax=Ligilactobacillus pobuzihii TaxID=449659 RepID=UPI00035FF7FF|nr:zinc ribbon domain-containing protein [Ligilactobacillus pobuzihii]GEN49062.1 zinc ribbon domain-containing protein [Ligilactobacillus pobuzihii]